MAKAYRSTLARALHQDLARDLTWIPSRSLLDPATLFASGEDGIWVLPGTAYGACYVERTSPTTVAGAGDLVGTYTCSITGASLTATADDTRPTLQTAGGLWWLQFDLAGDGMVGAADYTLSAAGNFVAAALLKGALNSSQMFGPNSGTTTATRHTISSSSSTRLQAVSQFSSGTSAAPASATGSVDLVTPNVISTLMVPGTTDIELNGTLVSAANTHAAETASGLNIRLNPAPSNNVSRFYAGLVLNRAVTTAERAAVRRLLASLSGVPA